MKLLGGVEKPYYSTPIWPKAVEVKAALLTAVNLALGRVAGTEESLDKYSLDARMNEWINNCLQKWKTVNLLKDHITQ